LLRELTESYQANGFANRNLFICVRRSNTLSR
jgi:ribosomal protein S18 acetylase RimI-like enzyme